MTRRTNILLNADWLTIIIYLVFVLFGWMNIFAANYNEQYKNIFDLNQRYGMQLIWILASFVLAVFVFVIDSKFYSFFANLLYGITILFLIFVILVGREVHGARSWVSIGGFNLQPSEFAKFTTGLVIAKYLTTIDVKISRLKSILVLFGFIMLPAVLIILQPDVGSAMIYFAFILVLFREGLPGMVLLLAAAISILFLSTLMYPKIFIIITLIILAAIIFYFLNKKAKYLFWGIIIFLIAYIGFFLLNKYNYFNSTTLVRILLTLVVSSAVYVIFAIRRSIQHVLLILLFLFVLIGFIFSVDYVFHQVLQPHQQTRVNILLGKESDPLGYGYNVNQSKIAIGSGGFTGKGFLNGTQTKFDFVPEQSTDFIFCTIGEEWGFWGAGLVILLFGGLLVRLIYLAERQRSAFSRIYGYGVFSILFFHFIINIGMTIGLLPVIGIPLPFFSYGGSSLLGFTLLLFIFIKLDASRLSVLR